MALGRAPRLLAPMFFAALLFARDQRSAHPSPSLAFDYAGCARVRPGPVCELPPERELTFWTAGALPLELSADGSTARDLLDSRFVEGGRRSRFRVPAGARTVRLRAGTARAELAVGESSEPSALRELTRSWQRGERDRVQDLLQYDAPPLRGAERDRLRALRARVALREGKDEHAAAELESTAENARKAGLLLEASNDLLAAAYCRAVRLAQFARARALLDSTEKELATIPETRARLAYYRGVLARMTGDARGALTHFRAASVLARRLDLRSDELLARQELAVLLNQLRRHEEALEEQQAVVARRTGDPACAMTLPLENLAWILLSQPDPRHQQRAAAVLDRAQQQLAHCPNPLSRRNLRLNRVELALLRREAEQAEVLLRALEEDPSAQSTHLAAWQARAWGELHLLRGDETEAAKSFALAYHLAESAQLKDCAYLARLGRARALARQTDHEATLEAYLAAEDAADALVRWAPFGQGQQLTALQTQESSRELVSYLLARKDVTRARQAAVRAARRVGLANYHASRIASVGTTLRARWDRAVADYRTRREELERAARDDWKLSLEGLEAQRLSRALQEQELENTLAAAYALLSDEASGESALEPTDDDARLLLAPSSDAWWAFLWRRSVLSVALVHGSPPSVGLAPSAEQRRELERGLSAALERFESDGFLEAPLLRVSVPPELATLDVHALPIAGRTLIDRIPVAYDAGPRSDAGRRKRGEPAIGQLLLGDPNSDLPWAAAETRRLAKLLPGAKVLLGPQTAFSAVFQHLPRVHLLHFAGHASSGGLDGLEGALHLDAKNRISLGDVLALTHVPEFVVLSSCASSVSPDVGGGLSIGHAFLAAGARAVVGSSRTISDALAQMFMREFYERLLGDSEAAELPKDIHTWAEGIRAAGQAVRRSDGTADWAGIRLLLP